MFKDFLTWALGNNWYHVGEFDGVEHFITPTGIQVLVYLENGEIKNIRSFVEAKI